MKLTSRTQKHEGKIELQMTSMIDVVFLLLIFFLTTTAFVETERIVDSTLQVDRQSAAASQRDFEPAIIEVVRGDSGFVYQLGGREITTFDELVGILSKFENKHEGAFVRVSDEAPFAMAAAAIQASKSAGFAAVSYVPISGS